MIDELEYRFRTELHYTEEEAIKHAKATALWELFLVEASTHADECKHNCQLLASLHLLYERNMNPMCQKWKKFLKNLKKTKRYD